MVGYLARRVARVDLDAEFFGLFTKPSNQMTKSNDVISVIIKRKPFKWKSKQ